MVSTLEKLKKYQIILASGSPRRKELLTRLDIDFVVKVIENIDESYPTTLPITKIPEYISRKKAEAYRSTIKSNDLIITADTIVIEGNHILGKPKNENEAYKMLNLLSGHVHKVITGVTIMTFDKTDTFSAVSNVRFVELCDEEIRYYIKKYKPYDKAGAYGIQEWIGMIGISELSGSYFNVMGLPIQRLYSKLKTI